MEGTGLNEKSKNRMVWRRTGYLCGAFFAFFASMLYNKERRRRLNGDAGFFILSACLHTSTDVYVLVNVEER